MALTSISPDFRESLRELADNLAKKQAEKAPKTPLKVAIRVVMDQEEEIIGENIEPKTENKKE
jgi:CRISPR/Cas system-associated protein Csm6